MGLARFSAKLNYTSEYGCTYQETYKQSQDNPDAKKVFLDLVEHLAWMGAVGGQASEVVEAFNKGHKQGLERRKELDKQEAVSNEDVK